MADDDIILPSTDTAGRWVLHVSIIYYSPAVLAAGGPPSSRTVE